MTADATIGALVERAWDMHRDLAGEEYVVRPSAPILFFGDLMAYLLSDCRILTVGGNLSRREFPEENHRQRFITTLLVAPLVMK